MRRYRASEGIKGAALAKTIGVSKSMLSYMEAGARMPSLAVAVRLERATRGWPEGPIRPSEWLPAEGASAA